jgi:hypothetical protein
MTGLELCQAFKPWLSQLSSTVEKTSQVQPNEAERVSSS